LWRDVRDCERRMKILVACEYSGRVREAFRKLGHDAWSCDLLPSDDNSPYHIQGDVLEHCTYLSYVGNRHWNKPGRAELRKEALDFFVALAEAPIPKICVENPLGEPSRAYRKYDQIIQPYYFGEPYQKRTCLWLKGLPLLTWDKEKAIKPPPLFLLGTTGKPINWVEGVKGISSKDRWKIRSTTFQGIADAFAAQWGSNMNAEQFRMKGEQDGFTNIPRQ